MISDDPINTTIRNYVIQLAACKENLIARYMLETGLKASEIVIIEQRTPEGFKFYPARKKDYELPKEVE